MSDTREVVKRHWLAFAKTQWGWIKRKETASGKLEKGEDTDGPAEDSEWRVRGPARQPAKRLQPPGPKKPLSSRKESPVRHQQSASLNSTQPQNAPPEPKTNTNILSSIAKIFNRK